MVSATVGDTLDKRIGIKNEAVHENSFFGVQILVSNGIKTLLIKETLVPQTVGLSVKQGLEKLSKHHLYLTCKTLTIIKGEQLEQMLLGRGQGSCLHSGIFWLLSAKVQHFSVSQSRNDEKTWIRQWKEAFLQKLFEKNVAGRDILHYLSYNK